MVSFRARAGVLLAGLWLFFMAMGGTAEAHFASTGFSDITVKDKSMEYNVFLLEKELLEALPEIDTDGNGRISTDELSGGNAVLTEMAHDRLIVTGDGKIGAGVVLAAKQAEKAKMPMIEIDINYDFGEPVDRYMVQYNFYDGTNPDHRSYATIRMGQQSIVQVINSSNNILQMEGYHGSDANRPDADDAAQGDAQPSPITAASSWTSVLKEYVTMGMEHIWSGADHMLFLCGLILASGTSGWTMLKLVSAFTVGHSITLVLSALDLASLSPLIVEPLIALSIVFIAFETMFRKKFPKLQGKQIAVTVMFGMVHGFGFAEILHGTMAGNIALPLFSFNLGVEIGQLVVLAIVIPILWAIRKLMKQSRHSWWTYATSSIVGLMGLYWLIERLVSEITM
ncbi:HupE/UreJ family protein [Paenibacillus glycanilyticus]|uniref:Membrane protein n=1 Tax=Paenibacillus glycanilyticus TaxID=126569 RepID=A0ABQ6G660_9BACL|nr:HupE/UreJ family protein [Paenibacillus glycanilyticus]GLX65753.1 membrane protein [Paenibacillus glycanilyticus]